MAIKRNSSGRLTVSGTEVSNLASLVEGLKTPFFIYDIDTVAERVSLARKAFPGARLLYAVKANPHPGIISRMAGLADGFDISSGGEFTKIMDSAHSAGIISFAAPAKTETEISSVLTHDKSVISIESEHDFNLTLSAARACGLRASVTIRINPDEAFPGFALKMGGRPSQFGVDLEEAIDIGRLIMNEPSLDFAGVHIYSGTQCLDAKSISNDLAQTADTARRFEEATGLVCRLINFGGGLGVPYFEGDREPDTELISDGFTKVVDSLNAGRPTPVTAAVELGRYLIGPAGLYVTSVVNVKHSRGTDFLIMDGGMHHHLAASGNLGQVIKRNFRVEAINSPAAERKYNLAGPLCTPIDILGTGVSLPSDIKEGDMLAVFNSGAYGLTASPTMFLSRPLPAEIVLEKDDSDGH